MELNVDEALRYLGIGGQAAESIRASVAAVADKLTAAIQPRYTYRMCSLQKTEAGFLLPEAELVLPGADAAKMLEQCDQAVLMACTLGTQFETLLRREQARDMSRAVILAACGSAWVEAGCRCYACRADFSFTEHGYICPGCGEPALAILRGRELELTRVEWE